MSTGKELQKLRKDEVAASELLKKNKKKLEEIAYKIKTRELDLQESSIKQQRLKIEYDYKYSENSINTTESWERYLQQKEALINQIRFTKKMIDQEKNAIKACQNNAKEATNKGDFQEALAWKSKADDHQNMLLSVDSELKELNSKSKEIRKKAELDPEYIELQARTRLAKLEYDTIEQQISDLQQEHKAQKKVYEDSRKNHKAIREKIENFAN